MTRKRDLEAELIEKTETIDALKKALVEADERCETLKTRAASNLNEASFPTLLRALASRLDGEIEKAKPDAATHWSLITIQKGLKQIQT